MHYFLILPATIISNMYFTYVMHPYLSNIFDLIDANCPFFVFGFISSSINFLHFYLPQRRDT